MGIAEIIAQVLNGFGTTFNIFAINMKDKNKTLILFIIGNTLVSISLALLHANAGMIVQSIFVLETIINYFFEKKSTKYPIWLIIIYIIIPCSILFFTFSSGWDVLAILASIFFPLALISRNFVLRALNLISVAVWIPYNFHFGQYVRSHFLHNIYFT